MRDAVPAGGVAVDIAARFTPDEDGDWRLGVTGFGSCELWVDGVLVAQGAATQSTDDIGEIFQHSPQYTAVLPLHAGVAVDVRIHYRWPSDAFLFRAGLVVGVPLRDPDAEFAHAVELARTSDVAVVVVGTSEEVESEGFDRATLALPGRQDELVRAVAAVNRRTVVVVNAGAPVEMPWRDDVAAVLVAWFPGMEFGNALADVLLGAVEPGGRLPTTWPSAMSDAPVLETTPIDGRLDYVEGLDIGHRAYLAAGTEPAYWFGHGLGYTTWEYGSVEAPAEASGDGFDVTVRLRNTGDRRGKQVVQVYAERPASAVARPVRWLAGFAVVTADPGQTVDVPVSVSARVLRHWDTDRACWAVEPGDVIVSVGANIGDLAASATVAVRTA
jgi:beta-glucosidase